MAVTKQIVWNATVWQRAVDAVAALNGWTENVVDPADPQATIPNPQSKVRFFNQWLKNKAINEITEYHNRQALASVVPVTDTEV